MANDSNGAGKSIKKPDGMGIANGGGKVNNIDEGGENSMGVPHGQTPGIGSGSKANSMNQLPSNSRVLKSASSNLMTGMSQSRGAGGNK